MKAIVLDSEAISRLARAKPGAAKGVVQTWVTAAAKTGTPIYLPAAVLSEQYRGGSHDQAIDSCLSRYPGIEIVPTTRELASKIGHFLAIAKLGSAHHVDATVIAVAQTLGGAVILTSDPDDLRLLANNISTIEIIAIT